VIRAHAGTYEIDDDPARIDTASEGTLRAHRLGAGLWPRGAPKSWTGERPCSRTWGWPGRVSGSSSWSATSTGWSFTTWPSPPSRLIPPPLSAPYSPQRERARDRRLRCRSRGDPPG